MWALLSNGLQSLLWTLFYYIPLSVQKCPETQQGDFAA